MQVIRLKLEIIRVYEMFTNGMKDLLREKIKWMQFKT